MSESPWPGFQQGDLVRLSVDRRANAVLGGWPMTVDGTLRVTEVEDRYKRGLTVGDCHGTAHTLTLQHLLRVLAERGRFELEHRQPWPGLTECYPHRFALQEQDDDFTLLVPDAGRKAWVACATVPYEWVGGWTAWHAGGERRVGAALQEAAADSGWPTELRPARTGLWALVGPPEDQWRTTVRVRDTAHATDALARALLLTQEWHGMVK